MNSRESRTLIQNMIDQHLVKPEAGQTIFDLIDYMAAQCSAMRDHMLTILSVVSDLEDPGGPFSQARQYLLDADVGAAELDYRQALEEAARAAIEMFAASEADPIKRLAGILSQTPALFVKTDRLALFLDHVLAPIEELKASSFDLEGKTEQDKINDLLGTVRLALYKSVNITVHLDREHDQVWASIIPKGFEVSARSIQHKPERDRLYWLLADAADYAMDDQPGSGAIKGKDDFIDGVIEHIKEQLEYEFTVMESPDGSSRSTTYGVKLKGDK